MAKKSGSDRSEISRRQFLNVSGGALAGLGAGVAAGGFSKGKAPALASRSLVPIAQQTNPLESYPNRDWEQVYRDQ